MTIPVAVNARLKENYSRYVRRALALALLLHIGAFTLSPSFDFKPYEPPPQPVMEVVVPANFEIPEPPAKVRVNHVPEPAPMDDLVDEPDFPDTSPFDLDRFAPQPPAEGSEPQDYLWFTVAPEPIDLVRPDYPELSREAGIEGVVRIEALIGTDGKVERASILSSDVTTAMEASALEAAQKCRFTPAKQGTRIVKARVMIPFQFSLD